MGYIDFLGDLHTKTKRDYLERVAKHNKIECATLAKQYSKDYFDGDRKYGYGGYRYDGRWEAVARNMIDHYGLKDGCKILDVGCAKGYLLFEFKKILPGSVVKGIDISAYAINNAKKEVRPFLQVAKAQELPFDTNYFDLVISVTTLHNLYLFDLKKAISEIERVKSKEGNSHILVESYRNEAEKVNLLYWQLTCELLFRPDEWAWVFKEFGYMGDYSFIYFE